MAGAGAELRLLHQQHVNMVAILQILLRNRLEESRTTTTQRWREEPLRGERREGREGTRRRGAAWREERSVGGGTSAARCWLLAVGCCCWLLAGWLLASCRPLADR